VAGTVPEGSLFKSNRGNAELYIFKSARSSNIVVSWLISVNYMFFIPRKGASQKSSLEHVMFHILGKCEHFAKL
jgi:hypothetical protein